MAGGSVEVRCKGCQKLFWVEATDPRLPRGPFGCGTCDLQEWESLVSFTGPAEMILVETDGGSTLLDVLDALKEERVRVVVYRKTRDRSGVN